MARSNAVWGIDIGNSSLKALRCRPGERSDQIIADAFDYIEYPKILSQPGAEPATLVADALKQFASRNTVRGDRVAISVAGQNGLARFIKLPPVDSKKIPAIVSYEAKQQIPFALEDVVWDYQRMGSAKEEDGFALETEIGLFAMKRDQVFRALEPMLAAGIEIDFVQLTPLALYNFLVFDQLNDLPAPEEYDPANPPASVVVLCLGTDATDLVVSNGFKVWQRSVPLGGNHFTKALTKELKLTFAKAEHLKRNATAAKNPKAVFQAMRPVFNDMLTEIQRSIGYFSSLDRAAVIDRVIILGNAAKLPGLRRYLAQGLGHDVVRLDAYRGLTGAEVVDSPAFKENLLCFGTCYGLALQGMGSSAVHTNLLPREIVKDRIVREKKPWALAAVAMLLAALALSFVFHSAALGTVDESEFGDSESQMKQVADKASRFASELSTEVAKYNAIEQIGKNLVSNVEGRVRWLELLKAINACLPRDPAGKQPERIEDRNEVRITNLTCQKVDTLETWFAPLKANRSYKPTPEELVRAATASGQDPAGDLSAVEIAGPAGPGYMVQLTGYHFHNPRDPQKLRGAQFLRETLIANLCNDSVGLPGPDGKVEAVPICDLGIGYAALIGSGQARAYTETNPNLGRGESSGGGFGRGDEEEDEEQDEDEDEDEDDERGGFAPRQPVAGSAARDSVITSIKLQRFDFTMQFAWIPVLPSERHSKKAAATQEEPNAEL